MTFIPYTDKWITRKAEKVLYRPKNIFVPVVRMKTFTLLTKWYMAFINKINYFGYQPIFKHSNSFWSVSKIICFMFHRLWHFCSSVAKWLFIVFTKLSGIQTLVIVCAKLYFHSFQPPGETVYFKSFRIVQLPQLYVNLIFEIQTIQSIYRNRRAKAVAYHTSEKLFN